MKMRLRTYVNNYILHILSENQMASSYGNRDIGFEALFFNLNMLKSPIFSTFDPLEVVLNEDELKDICRQLHLTHLQ